MLRWVVHKQVNVVVSAVHLNQFSLEVETDLREGGTESVDRISVKYPVSILCYKDQVNMKLEHAMSTVSNVT